MKRALPLVILLALGACAPKEKAAEAPAPAPAPAASLAPDVAAAAAKGDQDPRIPTVDPATITDQSSVGDVMHAYVIPGSETLFAAESADAPADAEGWAKLRTATADIITGCKLLQKPPRSKGAGWNKACDTVIAATKVTATALDKNNAGDLVFSDGDMMAGCTSCHQQFRDQKPPEGKLLDDKPK